VTAFDPGGPCRRCGQPGHWADDPACPWLQPAPDKAGHLARIEAWKNRYWDFGITAWQKQQFIRTENEMEKRRK